MPRPIPKITEMTYMLKDGRILTMPRVPLKNKKTGKLTLKLNDGTSILVTASQIDGVWLEVGFKGKPPHEGDVVSIGLDTTLISENNYMPSLMRPGVHLVQTADYGLVWVRRLFQGLPAWVDAPFLDSSPT